MADGFVVWLTGLSGAGKTTIAQQVATRVRASGRPVQVLDGDDLRRNLNQGLGFSRADRDTNIRRIAYVAKLLADSGVVVVVAAISPYRSVRAEAREPLCERPRVRQRDVHVDSKPSQGGDALAEGELGAAATRAVRHEEHAHVCASSRNRVDGGTAGK